MADKTLHEVLFLASIAEKTWLPRMHALRASGIPLNLDGDDKSLLDQLREKRTKLLAEAGAAIEARETERSTFEARTDATDEDRSTYAVDETAFYAAHTARLAEIETIEKRISEQETLEKRRMDAAAASVLDARVKSEPLTYRQDNGKEVSYFRDLAAATVPSVAARMKDPAGANERLQRHAAEMNVELPKREAAREARARAQVDRAELDATGVRGLPDSPFEKRVNPNRTDGQGGFFVPPIWLVDDFIPLLRAGRVAAGLCRQMDLPEGTDSINIPKLATGTATAMQTADAAGVQSTDFTDTSIAAGVVTAAGQQDVSLQLVEQSPGQIIDQVIITDLMADYNRLVDRQVLIGTGTNGQVKGLLPVANWSGSTVTYTQASPATVDMLEVYGGMASAIATRRFSVEGVHFLVHPRRWFWQASGVDTTNRAQVVPSQLGPYNVHALTDAGEPAEGRVGTLPHLPNAGIYIDANVPVVATAAGAITTGTNDLALAAKWDDLWLFEGALRTRVLSEVLSGTLQIRFQVYNYLAFLARYGESIAVAQGTGLAAPIGTKVASVTF